MTRNERDRDIIERKERCMMGSRALALSVLTGVFGLILVSAVEVYGADPVGTDSCEVYIDSSGGLVGDMKDKHLMIAFSRREGKSIGGVCWIPGIQSGMPLADFFGPGGIHLNGDKVTGTFRIKRDGSLAFAGGRHGGHRGYSLSLWTEAMAVLAGGNAHDSVRAGGQNLMITAYAPAQPAPFVAEISRFHDLVRSNRRESPDTPIRLPGARALAGLQHARAHGLDIADDFVSL
jgi:hypothetical protein